MLPAPKMVEEEIEAAGIVVVVAAAAVDAVHWLVSLQFCGT